MTITLTLRISERPDMVLTYEDMDTAVKVLRACTDLPDNQITGWSLDETLVAIERRTVECDGCIRPGAYETVRPRERDGGRPLCDACFILGSSSWEARILLQGGRVLHLRQDGWGLHRWIPELGEWERWADRFFSTRSGSQVIGSGNVAIEEWPPVTAVSVLAN